MAVKPCEPAPSFDSHWFCPRQRFPQPKAIDSEELTIFRASRFQINAQRCIPLSKSVRQVSELMGLKSRAEARAGNVRRRSFRLAPGILIPGQVPPVGLLCDIADAAMGIAFCHHSLAGESFIRRIK